MRAAMPAGRVKLFLTLKTKELHRGASEALFCQVTHATRCQRKHSTLLASAPECAFFQIHSALDVPQHTGASTQTEEVPKTNAAALISGVFGVWTEGTMFPGKFGVRLHSRNTCCRTAQSNQSHSCQQLMWLWMQLNKELFSLVGYDGGFSEVWKWQNTNLSFIPDLSDTQNDVLQRRGILNCPCVGGGRATQWRGQTKTSIQSF